MEGKFLPQWFFFLKVLDYIHGSDDNSSYKQEDDRCFLDV